MTGPGNFTPDAFPAEHEVDPGPGPGYLEEAAAELRHARDDNDRRREIADEYRDASRKIADRILREAADRSAELAGAFTRLAAIERGLPPCCHHAQPEPEPQS